MSSIFMCKINLFNLLDQFIIQIDTFTTKFIIQIDTFTAKFNEIPYY